MTKERIHISKHFETSPEQSKVDKLNGVHGKLNRRNFIKLIGLSTASIALIEACKKNPILKNIPNQKATNKKGKTNFYSTSCGACTAHCHLQVKCYDNIPIKIEGNPKSPINYGAVCAFGQASLLSLYNDNRPKEPTINKSPIKWNELDIVIRSKLEQISASNKKTIILSNTINSPSTLQLITEFATKYPGTEHIIYDCIPSSGILNAHERCFGNRIIPNFLFHKSRVMVSFNADFLNSWLSPVEYTHKFSATRDIERKLDISNHIQFESVLSATGAIADDRLPIDPSEEGIILIDIYNEIAAKAGSEKLPEQSEIPSNPSVKSVSELLWKNKGRSLVISANNDTSIQMIICGINSLLGNYGRTIDIDNPSFVRQGNDDSFKELLSRMEIGDIKGMLILDCDPCADSSDPDKFSHLLKGVETSILLSSKQTATSEIAKYNCPAHHFLESWNDHKAVSNIFSLSQAVISPIFTTRQMQECLLKWIGKEEDFYSYLRRYWLTNIFKENNESDFNTVWDKTLTDGFYVADLANTIKYKSQILPETDARYILNMYQKRSKTELILFESPVHRNASQSTNLWLNELPDPATKICYDAFCVISPQFAAANDINEGDIIEISNKKSLINLPAAIVPGTAINTVGVPLMIAYFDSTLSLNNSTFKMLLSNTGNLSTHQFANISIKNSGRKADIVCTQIDQQLKKEVYIKDFSIEEYFAFPIKQNEDFKKVEKYKNSPHKWVMIVDLNLCTGCSSCIIACQSENNIPTVGRKEMIKNRQMHWLRVDKYYHSGKVHFMPIMCQQCNNAPCEPVCPVSATSHSLEGLNQQNYQRCIGARFCASNCPYDVRRFNFDQYYENPEIKNAFGNETAKLSINPEVSIRSRGVVEKCSFCIQRIQDAKAKAKNADKPIIDGNISLACEQSCPANAIIFGDAYDKSSRVYHLIRNKRAFTLLPELNTQPSVNYLAKVRKSIFKDA